MRLPRFAGITVTDRRHASALALVTGHEQLGKPESALDYQALANFPGTLVVYMGVRTAETWSTALLDAGKPADTPVMLLRRCSWPDQRRIQTTLGQVAQQLTPHRKFPPPVVSIVGEAARANPDFDWFARLPLFGQRVLVTRPVHQASSMINRLSELGAHAILSPTITIAPPHHWQAVDAAIARLDDFDYLVFSSSNGVHYFFRRLLESGRDMRRLSHLRLAVIGPRTAEALRHYSLHADIQPDTYRAEALAEALIGKAAGKHFLLLRASRGRDVLADTIRDHDGIVEQVVVYESVDIPNPDESVEQQWAAVDWVTVTSSAIARSLYRHWGDRLRDVKLVSISPITTQALKECGLAPTAEATEYTSDGVVDAILESQQSTN